MYIRKAIKEFQGFYCGKDGEPEDPSGSYFPLEGKEFESLEKLILSARGDEDSTDLMTIIYKRRRKVIQAKNFVGVIRLPSGRHIEILPKIDIANDENYKELRCLFLKMLASVLDLDNKSINTADLDKTSKLPLFEIFIRDFCEKVRTILRLGVKHDYAIQEDNLAMFKGKLKVGEHVRRNVVHRERFYVAYDEFGFDAVENRVIKAALIYLRNKTTSSRNQIDILQLLDSFEDVPDSLDIKSDIQVVLSKRIDEHYRAALRWSVLFLRGDSFSTFSSKNGIAASALLFPMEKLFESFVAKELRSVARKEDWGVKVKAQEKSKYLFDSTEYMGKKCGGSFRLKPDIVLRRGEGDIVIADTKWKELQFKREIPQCKQSDIYQMCAYHRKYSREGKLRELLLVYPKTEEMSYGAFELGRFEDRFEHDDFVVTVLAYDLQNSNQSARYILHRIYSEGEK